jgi:arabinogalactan endo-1,4-beta-galactosidase
LVLLSVSVLLTATGYAQPANSPDAKPAVKIPQGFIIGADISWVQAAEDRGVRFSDNGVKKDILEILKDHGFN